MSVISAIYLLPVRFYRRFISPALGNNCIYSPSCSEYFMEAVQKHGIIRGTVLGTARIFRCSRFFMGGEDPVPEQFSLKTVKDGYTLFRRHKQKND